MTVPRNANGMPLRHGVHAVLEDQANEILRQSLSKITRHADKADVLTPWKEKARRDREVLVREGTPDGALRRGNFNRAWNSRDSHLNSVEGMKPPREADRAKDSAAIYDGNWDSE